ncbi:MAG: tyrosine-type recombinase/integrase [Candidatus Tectomicrobia bacterium]|nr:tyrosine-type recombinase/integrase [Candidatus Tectomicrobia bacterium]
MSALRKLQALAIVELTARDQLVADTLSGLARQTASPRQVSTLTMAALAAIYETACLRRIGRGGALESAETALRQGLVDIALCWVLSDAGLRRSEAAALTWDDITRWDNGSGRLTARRSKTDAGPRTVYLTPVAMAHLDAIRPEDADGSDPVFGLSEASISRRVKAAAWAAGYSGHSGRVGMARRIARAGAPTHEIMAQGRWKSAGMVADYTRAENAERAAKWLG